MEPMTPSEARVFVALRDYTAEHGYTPSLREIAEQTGLRSIATVQRHLVHLRKKGYVDWVEGKKRTLRVIHG